jgi:hypothetical protein
LIPSGGCWGATAPPNCKPEQHSKAHIRHGPAYRVDPTFRNHQLPADVSPHRYAPIASEIPLARRSQHTPLFMGQFVGRTDATARLYKTGQRRKADAPSARAAPDRLTCSRIRPTRRARE